MYEPIGKSSAPGPALSLGAAYEHVVLAGRGELSTTSPGGIAELSLLFPLDVEGNALGFGARLGAGRVVADPALRPDEFVRQDRLAFFARVRTGQGRERVATYVELDLGGRVEPVAAAFVRLGFGAQLRLSGPLSGFAGAGASIGVGGRLVATADAGLGLRLEF